MRPLRLVVEGFTAFRARQEISFADLALFAIAGATGAGKSTILDAMMYALFGRIPRLGGVGYQEIISHGAARLAVTFDFVVRGRTFRVVRALKRGGTTTTQLAELDAGGNEQPLADKVKDVDRRIEAILGLDFEAFAQAVVLPQGEFQSFLKAPAGDRRRMLSRLLRLERYDAMRADAAKRTRTLEQHIGSLERRLADDYAGVDAAQVAAMQTALADADEKLVALHADVTRAEKALAEVAARAEQTATLATRVAEQNELTETRPKIDAARARLLAAQQAIGLREVFATLAPAAQAATEAAEGVRTSRTTHAAALAAATTAAKGVESAELAAAELPALRQQVARLDEAVGLQDALRDAQQRVTDANTETQTARDKHTGLRDALPPATTAAEKAQSHLAAADAALAKLGYAPERHAALGSLAEPARQVTGAETNCAALQSSLADEASTVTTQQAAHTAAAAAAAAADEAVTKAEQALRAAEAARERELRTHHAHLVRQDLRQGEPCPVCEQTVSLVPAVPAGAREDLAAADATRARAQDRVAAARADAKAATKAASATETKLREATGRRDKAREQLTESEALRDAARTALEAAIRDLALSPPPPADATAILAEEVRLAGLRATWDLAQRKQRDAERAQVATAATLATLTKDEADTASALAAAQTRLRTAQQQADAVLAKIKAVAGDQEPSLLRRKLAARAEQLVQALATAKEVVASKDAAVEVATAALEGAEKQARAAAKVHADLAADVARRSKAAGFASEADAHEALLDDDAMRALEAEVREHDARCTVLALHIRDLEAALGERRATAADVAASEAAKLAANKAHADATEARTRLHEHLTRTQLALRKALDLREELATAKVDAEVYGILARELQTDGFLDFLLQESTRQLVAGASVRLRELSARYSLETRAGDFLVVDHDNADEQRSVDTLSGGETFLVSLALALELSAQIQATAGAVELDSIFIDEGFGTLDAETLEAVAGAIESLPHSGRMVGIITHVTELTERMPARLVVEKGAESSSVRLVTG